MKSRNDIVSLEQLKDGAWVYKVNLGECHPVTEEVIEKYPWMEKWVKKNAKASRQ